MSPFLLCHQLLFQNKNICMSECAVSLSKFAFKDTSAEGLLPKLPRVIFLLVELTHSNVKALGKLFLPHIWLLKISLLRVELLTHCDTPANNIVVTFELIFKIIGWLYSCSFLEFNSFKQHNSQALLKYSDDYQVKNEKVLSSSGLLEWNSIFIENILQNIC